jgi:hypothetical protein
MIFVELNYRYMLEETSFGDQICLKAFSYSTGCRITVLQSKFLTEQRFRHKKELCDGDFILVHNGEDHFVGASKSRLTFMSYGCPRQCHGCPVRSTVVSYIQM